MRKICTMSHLPLGALQLNGLLDGVTGGPAPAVCLVRLNRPRLPPAQQQVVPRHAAENHKRVLLHHQRAADCGPETHLRDSLLHDRYA